MKWIKAIFILLSLAAVFTAVSVFMNLSVNTTEYSAVLAYAGGSSVFPGLGYSSQSFGETAEQEEAGSGSEEYIKTETKNPAQEYPQYLESTLGFFTYYNQSDSKWADSLYGPRDRMKSHGCGPTALAMIVSSYTNTKMTPDAMAVWADQNGYCVPGQGSLHALIPEGCAAFGLDAVSMSHPTEAEVLSEVQNGKIVVALMRKGYFTDKGHFLIIIKATEDGKVRIADPANQENNNQDWDLSFILSQVRKSASSGGPLWSIGSIAE